MILNIEEIKKLIPHREPFLFIDTCNIKIPGEYGVSSKVFKENEYFFKGHFPNNPIVPGVIIVEAMAQTAGIVVSYNLKDYDEKSVLFMSVSKAKFRKPILPNDKILFEVRFLNKVKNVYKFSGLALKNDTKVSESEFSAMITYK
jgi:3-hydroxyacyl-[acyl-carrier-protein] dehydratase|tara:strand:- start:644 stop:1078 length:435 start_codon:yes stop_codon:yes gene_type:complete